MVVEDEFAIVKIVRFTLERDGHDVAHARTGGEGLDLVRSWDPDVVVLDLLLPDVDGRDVAREVRSFSDVPILMVTALTQDRDRIKGLELGADDYVTKPFNPEELAARIRAVARRAKGGQRVAAAPLQHRDLKLDPDERRVLRGEEEVALTKREFEILRMLMQQPGKLVSRSAIAHAVWGRDATSATNLLDVHMSSLRRKLGGDAAEPAYIETVRGEGFRLGSED